MALQVWLPLNGNLNNQGLADVTVTNNGATVDANGKIGSCYSFDGTNDYISGSYTTSVNQSFCCWVYFIALKTGHVFDARTPSGVGYQPIYINGNSIQIGGSGGGYATFSYTWEIGKWYHVCVTHDEAVGKLYINGVLINQSTTAKGKDMGEANFTLGCRCNSTNFENVKLNDVRIYDHALSTREVAELAKGLVLHYPLNDAYYTGQYINTVFDTSGYNNNGISYYLLNEIDSPRYSSAAAFDGQNIYISLISSSINNLIRGGSTPFTVAFWVSHDDSTRAILFGDYGLGGINFNIELSAYHDIRFYWNGSPDKIFGTIPASTWTHICIVYNGTGLKCYSNGVLIGTYSSSLAQKTKNSNIEYRLGKDSRSDSTMFYGRMSDFRIYATALTADQVKQLYEVPISLANNGTLFANEFNET